MQYILRCFVFQRGPLRLFYSIYEVPHDNRKRKLTAIPEDLEISVVQNETPSPAKVQKDVTKTCVLSPIKKKGTSTPVKDISVAVTSSTNANPAGSSSGSTQSVAQVPTRGQQSDASEPRPAMQEQTVGTSVQTTFPSKPVEPLPVKRKVGRPPKNPKTGPKLPPKGIKLQGMKKPPAPLFKLATSQAKLISSNAKSPITQSKTFQLVPRITSPPTQIPTNGIHNQVGSSSVSSSSASLSSSAASSVPVVSETVSSSNTAKQTTITFSTAYQGHSAASSVLTNNRPGQPVKRPENKPKCINTISNKLLASQQEAAAKVTEATSPSKTNISVHRQTVSPVKPSMSSKGTSPMSPVTSLSLSPGKAGASPLASTPNRTVKSCSSSTQTGTPPHSKSKPVITSVSVATSPIATKSPSSGGSMGKVSPGTNSNSKEKTGSSVKNTSTPVLPPTKIVSVKSQSQVSPSRNLFQEILGVKKPKVADSTSQTTKSQLSPAKNKVSVATSPTGSSPVKRQLELKSPPPIVGTKRDASTSSGGLSPPTPTAAHRPHIAAAVAPTPPKRPYLPVASGASASGPATPPLRLKISSPGTGEPSLVKSSSGEQTRPIATPVAHSNSKVDNEVKDKKSTTSESSAVEVRGPEQEVPLDLGTRKSVPVK